MYCAFCGKKINSKNNYCRYCGQETKKNKESIKNGEYIWACDFCEKEFVSKNLFDKHELSCVKSPKNTKFPYLTSLKQAGACIWLTTLTVFALSLFIESKIGTTQFSLMYGDILRKLFFGNITLGAFAFLVMLFSSKSTPGNIIHSYVKNVLIMCIIYLVISPAIFALEGYKIKNNEVYGQKYYSTPPVSIPTATPIPEEFKNELFEQVNNYRQEKSVKTLSQDAEVCKIAERLAKRESLTSEVKQADYSDLCPTCSQIGYASSEDRPSDQIFDSLINSANIKDRLLDDFSYACVAVFSQRAVIVYANKYNQNKTDTTNQTKNTTSSNTVECVGPDGKQFKTTMEECKKLNETWGTTIDYMINCTYPPECGGGVKYIKKSECDKPCAQVINSNQTNIANYPPCTVYYPSLNRFETYYYTSPSDCQKWKDSAKSGSTQIIPTSYYIVPTAHVHQTPTPNQTDIDARISRCKSDCITSIDSYITSVRNKCRANGSLGSSYCMDILDSRNALVLNCQSNCF